jgi:RNA polymerase sigma-70 factor (ECF subfamily)
MSGEFEKTSSESPGSIKGSNRVAEFERHRQLLFSIAYRMLGSVADAEDVLQDAFIRWQGASKTEINHQKRF